MRSYLAAPPARDHPLMEAGGLSRTNATSATKPEQSMHELGLCPMLPSIDARAGPFEVLHDPARAARPEASAALRAASVAARASAVARSQMLSY